MANLTEYIGTYKVYKVFRISRKRQILRRGLTRDEAIRVVNSYKNSSRSMVVFDKQYTASKYYKTISTNETNTI